MIRKKICWKGLALVVMIIYQSLFLLKFYEKVLAVLKRTGIGKFRMKYRDLELDKEKCVVLMKGQEIHLTSTEYKLLLYLMENREGLLQRQCFWNSFGI